MASHILGTAFFLAGFEVQDAPRFGAERRGAPIFAYVRAQKDPIEIGKLAIKTGVWPLKEYEDGKAVHTHIPARRLPVTEYLKKQGRFAHLFQPGNQYLIKEMQAELEVYWDCVEKSVGSSEAKE